MRYAIVPTIKGTIIWAVIKNGKVPGMKLNKSIGKLARVPVGAIGIASAVNIAIIDAIQAGSFLKFGESLLSKETLTEAFVPGVGSYHSIQRAMNTNDPLWLKSVDVGINVAGDVILAAGYIGSIFSFGTSGAGAIALRGGIATVGKKLISRQSLKYATKAAKNSAKQAVKVSMFSAPFSITVGLLANKIKGEDVENEAKKVYMEKIENDEQKRSREILKRINNKAKKKKTGKVVKLSVEGGTKTDAEIENLKEAA
mgnify:CR=1 FL=1